MAGIYDTFAAVTSQLLRGAMGGNGILRRTTGGGYDDEGNPIEVKTQDIPVACVVRDQRIWNKGSYLGTEAVAILDSRTEPQPDDQLVLGETTYTIGQVRTKAPAGQVLRYEAVLR